MRASESTFQSYKSTRILSFTSLICSSISGPKAPKKKTCLRFAIPSYSEKLWSVFELVLEKCLYKNRSNSKIFRQEKYADKFLLFICQSTRGILYKVYYGEAPPRGSTPYTFMSFWQKTHPLYIPFVEKRYLFHIPTCNSVL